MFIRGVAAIGLGALIVIWRDVPLFGLTLAFFGYAMIDGLLNLAGAVTAAQSGERWTPLVIEALTGIAAALIAAAWPGLTMFGLIYVIAAWGLATGALEIFSAMRLRQHIRGEWLMLLSGASSIALGLVMVAVPLAGPSGIAFWLGVYAFLFGALLVLLAFRFRALVEQHAQTA